MRPAHLAHLPGSSAFVLLFACVQPAFADVPADTTDSGLIAAARAQITAGQAGKALSQLTPWVDEWEAKGELARHEALLALYVEALGRGTPPRDDRALRRPRAALDLAIERHGARSPEAATAMVNLGRFRLQQKQAREARVFADSAVALRRALLGPDAPELAAALVIAGRAARENDDPDGSERCADEVYAIRARTLPPDHLDVAAALNNRAIARRLRGDYAGAYADGQAAVAIYELKLPPTHLNRILACKNTATSAMFLGEPLAGVEGYRKAIAGYEAAAPLDSTGVAIAYDELGLAYKDLGDYDQALASHKRAWALVEGTAHPDSMILRNLATNHGETLRAQGDFPRARAEFERALALDKGLALASREAEIALEHNLGLLSDQEGHAAEAVSHLTRALALKLPRTGEDGLASVLVTRAAAWHHAGRPDSARADLERAYAIAQRTVGPSAMFTAQVELDLAQLDAEAGDSTRAFERALAAEATVRARVRQTLRYLSERQARAFARARPRALNLVLSLATAHPDTGWTRRAWDCLVRSRGLVLDEFAARQAGLRGGTRDSAVALLEERVAGARRRMANLILGQKDGSPDRAARNALASAAREAEEAERALARLAAVPGPEAGLAEVLDALPAGDALLAYVRWNRASTFADRSEPAYAAFIARKGALPEVVDLGAGERIDDLVRGWRAALARDDTRSERAAGARLATAVWLPVAPRVSSVARLWLVPDASLNDVAWYALPDGAQRLLDSDLEIHLLSAGRDLVKPRAGRPPGPVLVLGGADFELRPAAAPDTALAALRGSRRCEAFAARRFGRLPFSAREARGVASLARSAGEVIELRGRDAGEKAFVRNAPDASWIHAATHGFYVDEACRNPAWDRDEEIAASAALEPMLYSGIALAGANRRAEAGAAGDDGIVTADEFTRMDLSRVRGMVITGCDTGLGDYVTGEGVYGLRRALERAGVGSLTLALWPVDDQAAARWALAFYDGLWRRGLSPATANRLAMRRVRQELRQLRLADHPRLWAGFVDSGIAQ